MVTGFRYAARTVAALAVALAVCRVAAVAADDPPPIVKRAVAEYAADHRGAIAMSRHLSFTMHVGPMGQDVTNEVGIFMHDGAYVKTKYYAGTENGKTDDDASLRKQEDKANEDIAAGKGFFKRPMDPRFTADYKFDESPCACWHDTEHVKFTSLVRDASHGDGTMIIDKATARVQSIEYDMNKPPDHATSGHVIETYGEAIPGLWTCVKVEETYSGKVGFVGGNAHLAYTLDHFRRFAQTDAAVAAIANRTL
jgi:hypothetical protein